MNFRKIDYFLLFSLVLILLLGAFLEKHFNNRTYGTKDVERFRNELQAKQEKLHDLLISVIDEIKQGDVYDFFKTNSTSSQVTSQDEALELLVFKSDTLRYWSDNDFPVDNTYKQASLDEGLNFLGNAWFLSKSYKIHQYDIVGLIKIKNEYPYQNKFLKSDFSKDFKLPSDAEIVYDETIGYPVYGHDEGYLFSVLFMNLSKQLIVHKTSIIIIYICALLLLLLILSKIIKRIENIQAKKWALLGVIVFLTMLRWLMVNFHVPNIIYQMELFLPHHYAASNMLPSLGDFLINSVFFLFVIYIFYHHYHLSLSIKKVNKSFVYTLTILYLLLIILYFVFVTRLFESIIVNSDISFEAHKVIDINIFSFVGLFSIALQFIAFVYITDKLLRRIKESVKITQVMLLFIVLVPSFYLVLLITGYKIDMVESVFLILLFLIIGLIRYEYIKSYQLSRLILLAFLFSIYSAYFILNHSEERIEKEKRFLAAKLASEHDPIAELLIEEAEAKIKADTVIIDEIFKPDWDFDKLFNHIKNRYFSGYLDKFDFQITICDSTESVLIEPDFETFHCYTFFQNLVKNIGLKIPRTNFYYIDNLSGRISYMGRIPFSKENQNEKTIFFMLDSRLVSEDVGYPELMLDESNNQDNRLSEYSYAKYFQNKLINKSGPFKYNLEVDFDEKIRLSSFFNMKFSGYNHLVYKVDKENYIIISHSDTKFIDSLILFSYIFAFYFVLVVMAVIVINLSMFKKGIQPTFKNRIQFSIVSVLFLSLLFIGGGTILLSIRQYKTRNVNVLTEKMQSVYIELIHKLEFEKELTREWYSEKYGNLDDLMRKFANVFYTDINLYDPNGELLATSRPEVFQEGLTGNKMDVRAFNQMVINKNAELVHEEQIGKLKYMSAYVPFVNNENTLLAYLNLPYFIKQDTLAGEVSTLFIAIINIYVLLTLIAVAIAVLVSNQITQPLRLIQRKMGDIHLGEETERIEYNRKDEIRSLVDAYNMTVDELEQSALLLARSERESAWREMAKQIAHEIKNPLTPMRLSVQQLERTWSEKGVDLEDYIAKFTSSIIEQIDSLSAIASEFSNFAKIPKARFEKIKIVTKLINVHSLFKESENINISMHLKGFENIYVRADKEQLARVFINIIKNALQSIPSDREGKIDITLQTKDHDKVVVAIKDNGNGIPDEMKTQLFIPNFTTKSSGMGLGLAITKNIVEETGGSIYFETEVGKGTIFFIELPVYK